MMIRSRKQSQAAAAGGTNGINITSSNGTSRGAHRGSTERRNKSSIIPTSLIGTLIISCGLILFLLVSTLSSKSNNSAVGNGSGSSSSGVEIIKDGKNQNAAKQLRRNAAANNENASNNNNQKSTPQPPPNTTSPTTGVTLHIIFSTDCSPFQHWQSYLFFHRAYTINQPGYITRIASGCTDEQLHYEKLWHETRISNVMSDRYRIHFTPHFSGVKDEITGEVKGDYKFFNKPFGLKHFLEYNDLLGLSSSSNTNAVGEGQDDNVVMRNPNDIIILCDPDFALLRPLTDDFSNARDILIGPRKQKSFDAMSSHIVTHGQPFAQTYGLGTQWRKFNIDEIAGVDSPAKDVSQSDGGIFYPAGPPYIGTARDMYNIAVKWSEFAPKVHKEYPHLLAEMYAYCIAAAHLRLPHALIDSMMISSAGVGGEGWKFIKDIPNTEVCSFGSNPDNTIRPIPSLIHYCQRYVVDNFMWTKRKMPHDIFTCDHPLFVEPPNDLGLATVSENNNNSGGGGGKSMMNVFMICALTKFTNDAMIFFKDHHCEDGGNRERKMLK